MSDRSRYLRFHAPMPKLSPMMRRVLCAVDGERHLAVVAEVRHHRAWHPVGIGRMVADGTGRAEVAVTVVDAWHGRGVGTRIVRALKNRALAHGVHELIAEVLPENAPMLAVLRRELPSYRVERSGAALRFVGGLAGPGTLSFTPDDLMAKQVA